MSLPTPADSSLPHVLVVITKGERGGAQSHVATLCESLQGRVAWEVAIGGAQADSPLARALGARGVPTQSLPALRNSLSPHALARSVRELRALIRRTRPQLLHAHSSVAGVAARIAARAEGLPVVYTVHGFGFKPQVPFVRRTAAWLAERALAPLTTRLIVVSAHERELARRIGLREDRITRVPNALADHPARAEPEREPARIVFVARLAPPKRADLLLEAVARLRGRTGGAPGLTLLGDGPERASLQAQAHRLGLAAARFEGDVSDVPGRIADHQVFILLSDHEAMPMSILEAMRAGLAIVASALPGIREQLRDGQEALLVENEAGAVASALARLLDDAPLRARLGQAARARFEAEFGAARQAAAVERIYRDLLEAGAAR